MHDRHRHQVDVGGAPGLDGVRDVGEQPVLRRAQLAGPRAAALHVPLEVEPLRRQPREVLADDGLVDRVLAEAAADEDDPAAPRQGLQAPDAQVVAAEHVVAREVVRPQHLGEHERVGVGAVRGQEHQRVLGVQLAQRLEARGVGVHLPRVVVHRAQDARRTGRPRVGSMRRDEALQILLGLGGDVLLATGRSPRRGGGPRGRSGRRRRSGRSPRAAPSSGCRARCARRGRARAWPAGRRTGRSPRCSVPIRSRRWRTSSSRAVAGRPTTMRWRRRAWSSRPCWARAARARSRSFDRRVTASSSRTSVFWGAGPAGSHTSRTGTSSALSPRVSRLASCSPSAGTVSIGRPFDRPRPGEPPVDEPALEDARGVDEDHERPVPGVGQRRRVRRQSGDPRRAHCAERADRAGRVRGGRGGDGRGIHGAPPAS